MPHFSRRANEPPRIYGHRGTRRGAPENTLRAMRLALAQGADGIELDVRLCASGEPVVVHDADLKRVAGVPLVIADTPLTELAQVALGEGERVPLLDEALELVLGGGHLLNVELKSDPRDVDALVRAVLAGVRARTKAERERVLFSSFDSAACRALIAADPSAQVALLFEHPGATLPPGCRAVHPHYLSADAVRIAEYKEVDLIVNVWTVNDPQVAKVLSQARVDGIVTDDVPLIRAHIV